MLDRPPAIALLAVGCLLALGVGGAGVLPAGDDHAGPADPETLVDEMLADSPRSVEGELEEVVERNDTVLERTRFEVVREPPEEKKRVRVVNPGEGNLTVVQNESTAWWYDEDEHEVTRYDREGSGRTVIVPAIRYSQYGRVVDEFETRYAGTGSVAGHDAHVVVFTDPSDEPTTASIDVIVGDSEYSLVETRLAEPLVLGTHRLWIHAEHDYPLKEQTTLVGRDGNTVSFTTRYEHIEFGDEHDDGTFTFDPPDDAAVREPPEMERERFGSVDAAEAVVPYAVPDPTVPAEFELSDVYVSWVNDTTRVSLEYADANETVRVTVWPDFDHEIEGVNVTVGDRPGTLTQNYARTSVYWRCDGRMYSVSSQLSTERQLAVAASVECAAADG